MRGPRAILATAAALALGAVAAAPATAAVPTPAWSVQALASPTNFKPGDESGRDTFEAFITNSGGKTTDHSPITIVDTLPAGLGVKSVELQPPRGGVASSLSLGAAACETNVAGEVTTVTCKVTDALLPEAEPAKFFPGDLLRVTIHVTVPPAASGPLVNLVEVKGVGAVEPSAFAKSENQASPQEKAAAGFREFHSEVTDAEGLPATGADSHPYQYSTSFAVNVDFDPGAPPGAAPFVPSGGDLRNIEVALPPGLAGNPTATGRCSAQQFTTFHGVAPSPGYSEPEPVNDCPNSSVVGEILVEQLEGKGGKYQLPLYNLIPPPGMPAQLGFSVLALPVYIDTRVRSDGDYGFTGYLQDITEAKRITAARTILWGTPADPSHDPVRGSCLSRGGSCPAGIPARPFLRLPSSCADPLHYTMGFDTWALPPAAATAGVTAPPPLDCQLPPFGPSIEARPSTDVADSPSGLHFDLHLPQAENEDPEGLGEADLRDATVTLPAGLGVNPSSAAGLEACSKSQIGYTGEYEGHPSFTAQPANCPDASKLGKVTVNTPLLDHPLPGAVYLASPHDNPFGSLLAIYIAIDDPLAGVVVKLAGEVSADPLTGRLATTVSANPQVPFEDFELDFFEGARAPLRTPATCATHTTSSTLVPWSAPQGPTAHPADSFAIAHAPGAGPCPASAAGLPNSPSFEAGTETPVAGATSPIVLKLRREDGSQEFSQLTVRPPSGLLARLAGTAYCPEASLAAAASRPGKEEQASPSCPAASELGPVTVAAGAGPAPYYTAGKAYLTGPYKGAPLGLATIVPAVAGPFDLGTVVVRAALHVDPVSTQITAVTDPIPHILQGIPLDVRSVAVRLDRPGWGLNPTSCEESSFEGELQGLAGSAAALHSRFQVGGCSELGFEPRLSLRLKGKAGRGGFPALRTVYRPRPGDANLKDLVLRFPHSEFIEQGHFRTICTRVQWAAGAGGGTACPPGSVYGHVSAITPLLDEPLEGPVYLRSSSHTLPDVVFALRGQVSAEVAVRVDSVKGGLRATLQGAPDVPVEKVVLDMQGGPKGLFVNSRDTCASAFRAAARLSAQNGAGARLRPALRNPSCGGAPGRRGGGHR